MTTFLVKSSTGNNGNRIDFTISEERSVIHDFILSEVTFEEYKRFDTKIDNYMSGNTNCVDIILGQYHKYVVRCEEQRNNMLQIYEIVNVLKGVNL